MDEIESGSKYNAASPAISRRHSIFEQRTGISYLNASTIVMPKPSNNEGNMSAVAFL
jgi:hypothetical protein